MGPKKAQESLAKGFFASYIVLAFYEFCFFIMFAVLLSGAKQYLVKEGDLISVEKLATPVGETHTFDKVLLISQDGKSVEVGTPFLKSSITGKVTKQDKAEKIRVFKMKAKKNYRRTYGHRQPFTEVEITKIG